MTGPFGCIGIYWDFRVDVCLWDWVGYCIGMDVYIYIYIDVVSICKYYTIYISIYIYIYVYHI